MTAVLPPKNVLYIHAMGALEGMAGITSSTMRGLNEQARSFSPNAHVLRIKGINLYNDYLMRRTLMQGIREHVAQHGTLDELVISTHGASANLSHFGGVERLLGQLQNLQTEIGTKIADRIVFTACNGFDFQHNPAKKIATMQSLAGSLGAELVGATSTVSHMICRNPKGPSLFGRFVKFTSDGRIERDILDTPAAFIRPQIEAASKIAKSAREIIKWPTALQRISTRSAETQTEYYTAMGWNVEDVINRALSKGGKKILQSLEKEADWVTKGIAIVSAGPRSATSKLDGLSQTVEAASQAVSHSHWGGFALAGATLCVGAAWVASIVASKREQLRHVPKANGPEIGRF